MKRFAIFLALFIWAALQSSAQTVTVLTPGNDFCITNVIRATNTIVSFPTNETGLITGKAINVSEVNSGMFSFGCNFGGLEGYNNQTANIVIKLVRSPKSHPIVAGATNDFETASVLTLYVPIPAGCTNGPLTWVTNLNADIIGGARSLGVLSITNNVESVYGTNAWAHFDGKKTPTALGSGWK
jgi:hypothetical protein